MSTQVNLFDNFPPVSTQEWKDRIYADLKGEDFEKLITEAGEGLRVMPFYRQEDISGLPFIDILPGEWPFLRGTSTGGNSWLIRQNVEVSDYRESGKKASDILMRGVDSIGFVIKDPDSINQLSLNTLLEGVHPGTIEISFQSDGKAREILDHFQSILVKKNIPSDQIRGAIEADPLGRLMLNGRLCISFDAALDYLAGLAKQSLGLPDFRTVVVNGSWIANAGGGPVTELAFALAMGNEYMSVFTERSVSPDDAASRIKFSFGVGSDYFLEIARLRAARLLWSVITGGYNLTSNASSKMEIHCVTARLNKKKLNPHVNLLRTQTEVMSAVLGGANSITVEPFDITTGGPDEFSERIARNQQLLLKEEAYFDRVADPAGGSWYIEKLTSMIAAAAWKRFIEIEEKGGFVAALNSGFIMSEINRSAERK